MKKQLYLSTMLLAGLLVTGCGLTQQSSTPDTSSGTVSIDPTTSENSSVNDGTHNVDCVTGDDPIEITGKNVTLTSGDEEAILIVQGEESALVYPLKGGKVVLTSNADTWNLNIEYDVFNFDNGADYKNSTSEEFRKEFRGSKEEKYTVGNKNAVELDLVFGYNTWVKDENDELVQDILEAPLMDTIKNSSIDLLTYSFSSTNVEVTNENLAEYVTVNDDSTLSFTEAANNKEFTIEVTCGGNSVTQNVLVNDGYNAYDTLSFKTLFEDDTVGNINVLRSFDAVLQDDQYYYNEMLEKLVPYNTTADNNARTWQGSLYYRRIKLEGYTPLVVNGNYMLIDGNKLPKHVPFNNLDKNGAVVEYSDLDKNNDVGTATKFYDTQAGALATDKNQITVDTIDSLPVNVQEGVFRVYNEDVPTTEGPSVILKNLEVRGNSQGIDEENQSNMYENSGGFIGFINKGTNVLLENTNFTYFTYGVQVDFDKDVRRSILTVKDSTVSDSWGPSIVSWRAYELNVQNSLLTRSGGPAIQCINDYVPETVEDTEGVARSITVNVDSSSVIDNYTTATAGWFNAHKINGIAQFVGMIDALVGYEIPDYPQAEKYTIINNNKYNFVALVQPTNETDSYATNDAHAALTLGEQSGVINPYRYKATPEVLAGGGMIRALGQDIDTTLYMDRLEAQGKYNFYYQYLLSVGTPDATAQTQASQLALAYYVQTYLDNLDVDAKYIEVSAAFPGFGYIGAVLEVLTKPAVTA